MDGHRALLTGGDGINGELRPRHGIAAGEHIVHARLIALRVRDDRAVGIRPKSGNIAQVYLLPDGGDNAVDGDGLKPAGADAPAPSLRVHVAKLHKLDRERLGLAAAGDLGGGGEKAELHALGLRLGDLVRVGGHLISAAAVNDRYLVRAEAHSGARHVDGDIAAADNGDLFADLRRFAEVDLAQEVNAGEHARKIVALAANGSAAACADAEIECLVPVRAQRVERDVLADLDPGAELHAELAQNLNLRVDDVLVQPE